MKTPQFVKNLGARLRRYFTNERLLRWVDWIHTRLERIRVKAQPHVDSYLADWKEDPDRAHAGFLRDADYSIIHQEPLRARVMIKTLLVGAALFIMWAAVARVDELTRGEGRVIPTRQLQVLQSLDGGIVSQILVQEGQVVEEGTILLRVDPTRFESSMQENRAQSFSLQAKIARLRALAENKPFEPPPTQSADDIKVVEEERRLYDTASSNRDSLVNIARQQLVQRQNELTENRAKREQAGRAYDLTAQELAVTKPLITSGAISEVELLRLERDTARFRGERDMASAQISKAQAAISEAQHKIEEVELNFRNDVRKELSDAIGKENSLSQGGLGLADKVKHADIRSPVRGTVKRLMVNTVGGVVQPGKDVVEVVPLEDALLLEAKVQPKDIAFLRPGQPAIVKFSAYDFSIYGGLEATLENIGADSITDEKGNTYYTVKVRTHKASLGPNLPIIPGMVAEVDIITGQKSVLSYLLKPVLRAKQAALSER
ncbi:MAG TPA: HlyD family type I secretion periplasmic adaptor subunit [Rhodocyclaceae bacterium]|nr:HlyD family type I secretion periplasmic adaptor subunit [Rhodocyclaceae bacterium]